MSTDHGAGAFAIDVEIADEELALGFFCFGRVGGEDRAGQAIF